MRWYKSVTSRGGKIVHAMDRQGDPACGTIAGRHSWKRADTDATCPRCLAQIAAVVSNGPVGFAATRILTAR